VARVAGAQHVQAHPRHDRREPPAEILDRRGVDAAQPQPGLLHRIVGLGLRAQNAVGDRTQARAVALELPGQLNVLVHGCHISHR
jgi:hypothetical protein